MSFIGYGVSHCRFFKMAGSWELSEQADPLLGFVGDANRVVVAGMPH